MKFFETIHPATHTDVADVKAGKLSRREFLSRATSLGDPQPPHMVCLACRAPPLQQGMPKAEARCALNPQSWH